MDVEQKEIVGRSRRFRPREALAALRRIRASPAHTPAMFDFLDALDGPFVEGWFRRFGATRIGRRILDEERDLLALLADRSWLVRLPEESLGRAYAEFAEREGLTPDYLAETGRGASGGHADWLELERERFAARLRDQHDLEHVVTGYGRDRLGETALLAFELAQRPSLGSAVLVALGMLEARPEGRRVLLGAFRRGRRAAWLAATDWESLLELPLADVRALLGVGEPPRYEESRPPQASRAA